MRHQSEHRHQAWRTLTLEQKQQRLHDLRRRQQLQVEIEMRRLHVR